MQRVPAGEGAVHVAAGGGVVHVPTGGGAVHGTVSEMETLGVTWIIMLLLCVAEHCLSVNLQEEVDEVRTGAAWGADVCAAEGSTVSSCAGLWVGYLHFASQ